MRAAAANSLLPLQQQSLPGPHVRCRVAPRIGLGALLARARAGPACVLLGTGCSAIRRGLGISISSSSSRSLPSSCSRHDSSSSSQTWQTQRLSSSSSSSRARLLVIAAGRPRKSEQQQHPSDPNSPELLQKLPVAELRALCEQQGLDSSGKKVALVSRLAQHLQEGGSQDAAAAAADAHAPYSDAGAAASAGDHAAGDDADITFEELLVELQAELQCYTKPALVECLQDRGLSTSGSKKELVERLAGAVAEESGMARGTRAAQQQQDHMVPAATAADAYDADNADDFDDQQQEQQQEQEQEQAAAPAGGPAAAERDWLVADKQQQLYDEMLGMGVKRQELLDMLAELGQSAEEDETMEELAERASWLLAEEEVLLMEQQQVAAGAGAASEGLAASPSSILDSLTATDINKMKVDELKSYLRQLGLSDEGGRYVLRDRLMTMLVVRRAATAGDMDHLLQQLSQMTLSELRVQLESRGLDLSGSKAALEMRLAQALVIEVVGPDAAGVMGSVAGQPAQEEDVVGNPLLDDYDELLTAAVDPAATIALVCGTAPVLPGSSSSSSTTERLQRLAAALATANTLIDQLHTAPLDEDQAAAMAAAAAAEHSSSSSSSSSETSKGRGRNKTKTVSQPSGDEAAAGSPACGISVDLYWTDDNGAFYQLPRTALAALAPADLLAQLPALATAHYADAAALAQHLAAMGVTAALSVLPGCALALSGQLNDACKAAGVPLAGGPAFESDVSKQLGRKAGPVLGRAAVLQELQALGYSTLPVLQLSRQELQAAADQLRAWLQDIESDIAETIAEEEGLHVGADDANAAAAAAAAAGDADPQEREETGGGSGSSALLRTWNQGLEEQGASTTAAAADDQQQEPEREQKPQQPELVDRVLSWCRAGGMDPDMQVFTVSSSEGGSPLGASRGYIALVSQLVEVALDEGAPLPGLLVEPLYRKLARWEVAVLASAEDGPVALLPAEVEQYSPLVELADADLALQEWQMMQAGMEEEEISQALEALAAAEPTTMDALRTPDLPDPLPYHTLKLHMPPRASTKVVQTIRHTAAKAVAQLGLEGAGLVRVSGWMVMQPDWQQRYEVPPEALQKIADYDAGQLARMAAEEAEARAKEPNPLCAYYDEELHMADLAGFDPAARMHSEGNGEGDVLLSDVCLDVPLAATSIAGLQALELGITPGGVARHLINLALLRHGKGEDELLPPPAKAETASSAQWAQATGVNDSLPEITQQLADAAVNARQEADNATLQAEVQQDREAFASLPFAEGVSEVLAALTKDWLTQEELAEPVEDPEEWTPEFDPRTQEEIHAERDAGRPEEDLAARAMRDEGLYHYGNQPVRYDRWGSGDDWVPPALEAAAQGQLLPNMRLLQQREDAKQQAKREELLNRQYSEQDQLPDVTEDEVLMGRILGHDRYKAGVIATLQRRQRQGGDPSLSSAAATVAAAGGPGSAGTDAAAAAAAAGGDEFERWPWPSEAEVVEEAAGRRPAPRVWVLVGGDGAQRHRAFRSGANVAAKLARCYDIQVDVFLLPPAGSGVGEAKCRSTLLSRRTEWRALGIPEELFPDSMTDEALINMPPADVPVLHRQVIVAGPQHLARHTLEEATEAAERDAARAGQAYRAAHVLEKQQRDSQFEAQMEVDAHLIQGVGSAWGAQPWVLPPAPRFLDMQELLAEATACDATLLLMLDDSTTATGQLQQILEGSGLPFTGMTSDFAVKCSNRLTLSKAIDEIADSLASQAADPEGTVGQDRAAAAAAAAPVGLVAVPKKVVKSKELIGYLNRPEEFEGMFGALLHEWDCSSVAIKPPTRSGGLGIMRVSGAQDLGVVAEALRSCIPRLPAGMLEQQPLPVTLPLQLPDLLVVEPWIDTDEVAVVQGQVQWPGKQRWVEVTVGLLGELGSMTALQPTLIAYAADGSRHQFTPPPQHILPAAAVEAVQGFAVVLADGLGLRSIAAVDGFVNVDSGELVVMDVQQLPDLSDGSPILQQVLANDPPMLPYQLFRHLAQQAYITQQLALEAAAAGGGSISSTYYSAPDEGGAGFGAADFDLGVPGDQGLGVDLFAEGGAEGVAEDDAAVDDEEVEGMAAGWTRQ